MARYYLHWYRDRHGAIRSAPVPQHHEETGGHLPIDAVYPPVAYDVEQIGAKHFRFVIRGKDAAPAPEFPAPG